MLELLLDAIDPHVDLDLLGVALLQGLDEVLAGHLVLSDRVLLQAFDQLGLLVHALRNRS